MYLSGERKIAGEEGLWVPSLRQGGPLKCLWVSNIKEQSGPGRNGGKLGEVRSA